MTPDLEYEFYKNESEEIRKAYREKYKKEYEAKKFCFSGDGIWYPKRYFYSGKLKIAFLLKENNNFNKNLQDEEFWCPVKNVENEYELYKSEYNKSSNWAQGLLQALYYARDNEWYEKVAAMKEGEEENKKACKVKGAGFAYLNAKKNDEGAKTSPFQKIEKSVIDDKNLLQRQIGACRPDVIFCCGSQMWDLIPTILGEDSELRERAKQHEKMRVFKYVSNGENRQVIAVDWTHPSLPRCGYSKKNCKRYIQELRYHFFEIKEVNDISSSAII